MRRASLIVPLLLFVVVAGGTRAEAGDDLQAIRRVIVNSQDPERRIAQIPRLVANGEPGAATLLGWLVGHDRTLAVRIGAAQGLGRIRAENATALLLEHIPRGGTRALRQALAASLARKQDGGRRLLRCADDTGRPRAERALLLSAMSVLEDDGTRERLVHYAVDPDPTLRYAALRALARREEGGARRAAILGRMLVETQDVEFLRELLDVLEPALDRTMKPALERLQQHEARDVAAAARRLVGRIGKRAPAPPVKPDGPADPDDRYGKSEPPFRPTLDVPPPPPATGRREDLVLAFDATGSARDLLARVVERAEREIQAIRVRGVSARIGVVLFRGGHGRGARARGVEVLPLTFDLDRVLAFLDRVDTRGTDDRGAAITEGLRQALDLSSWRWTAVRRVRVLADTGCDDAEASRRLADDHYRADGTTTAVGYFLRGRKGVPEDLEALARAGGTSEVEVVEGPARRHGRR